jgi:ribokinase
MSKLGETLRGENFYSAPGGKGANQAVGCSRLGAEVTMLGRVGDDIFGDELLVKLSSEKIQVKGVYIDESASTGVAVIFLDKIRQNRIIAVYGANGNCGEQEISSVDRWIERADCLMLQQEIPIKTSIEAAKIARQKGKLVVWDPAPASQIPDQVYELAQIMLPNQIEAEYLTGIKVVDVGSAEKAANIFLNKGIESIVIKMGSQGAFYATGSNHGYIPAFKVDVKDTVAAGDAFGAAFTYSYLNSNNFEEAVKFGVAAGCLSTTVEGAMDSMPFIDSVIKLVNRE